MIAPPPPASHLRFARRLLRAMGLPVAGAAALAAGCGGNVILEHGSGGSGGAGTSGGTGGTSVAVTVAQSTSTATSGVGGGIPGCTNQLPAGETLNYGCMNPTPSACPSIDDNNLYENLAMQLNTSTSCGQQGSVVQQVLCGPDPQAYPECCYYVAMGPAVCEGRPFTVEGHARTAPAVARAGFSAAIRPDVSCLDAPTRRALAEAWERDARYEHASIASFARFALELLAAGAPAALLADTNRALGDEIRHAELCFGLASAYAGAEIGPGPLPMEGALAGREGLAALAVAAVEEGCVGETIAALVAEAQRDAAEDPAVRAALDRIAEDEAAHAALAWRFVAWAVAEDPEGVGRAVAQAFSEAAAKGTPAAEDALPAGADAAVMRAHGRLADGEVRVIAAQAWAGVILPCARGLAGAEA